MAILYPGTLDTLTNPGGTQYLDSPSHSTQHSDLNDAIEALESKVGVGSGTPTVNKVMVGSGNGTATWSGTWNSATLGTPTITGGTVVNSLVGTSTITGGTLSGAMLIGTVQHTGGTVTGAQLGTNTITGGTATSTVLNSNTVGTPTITGGSWTSGTINTSVLGTPTITGGTLSSSTINNAVISTASITGGSVNSASIGSPSIVMGSDAAGDLYYRSSAGTVARLGIGTLNQVLQVSAGTLPFWADSIADGVTSVVSGTNLSGGTITSTGTISLAGTIQPTMIGTTVLQGGTVASVLLGTSAITGGTATSTVLNTNTIGTPNITGGSANSINLGTPTITVGSDATGDLFYRSSTGTIARLGIGNSTQVLTNNGTIPSWGDASSGVTSVVTGSNLTGGTITSTGTIAMAGTISPTLIGTTTILGGTINTVTLGTPTTTGGTYTSGTFNSATIGTPTVTGGNINVVTLGSPIITLGSDATGDIFYRNAGGSVARLAVGTPNQIIKVSAGTLPSWADNTADGVTSITTGANLSGGTITSIGTISMAGTISPTMIGTTTIQGGTAISTVLNNNTIGTPSITGGTINSAVYSGLEFSGTIGVAFGGSSAGITYGTRSARYTKIGQFISLFFYTELTNKGTATGVATITGLPVTSANVAYNYGAMTPILGAANMSSLPASIFAQVGPNSTTANLKSQSSTASSDLTNSNFTNTSVITGIIQYLGT